MKTTTYRQRELHRQKFLKRFLPTSAIGASDFRFDDENKYPFTPNADELFACLAGYQKLVDETPHQDADNDIEDLYDPGELLIAYMERYQWKHGRMNLDEAGKNLEDALEKLLDDTADADWRDGGIDDHYGVLATIRVIIKNDRVVEDKIVKPETNHRRTLIGKILKLLGI